MKTKLATVRKEQGLSQSKLANASGVPVKTIQCYEANVRSIDSARLDTLCKISTALNCKIPDLLENAELVDKFNKVK